MNFDDDGNLTGFQGTAWTQYNIDVATLFPLLSS